MIPAAAFLCALALSLGLTPLVRRLAIRLDVVDQPGHRKVHKVPIPLLGGAAIVISFTAVVVTLKIVNPTLLGDESHRLLPLLVTGTLIAVVGVWDDWKGLRAVVKLGWQVVAASILVFWGAQANMFTNPLGGSFNVGLIGAAITILWIVGVTNAVNLIDGLDGLAAGIGCIAALSLCAVGASADSPLVAFASLAMAGATLGFLPYNLSPARIFLGDTGSLFIGFILASLGAVGSFKASTTTVLVLPIVVLGIPVFDTLWAVIRRTHRRVSPFRPDRDHLHHRMVRVGLHPRQVAIVLYFLCAFLGLTAFIMVQLPYQTGFLFAGLLVLGGILGVTTLKYIEDHLEERLNEALTREGGARAEPVENGGTGSRKRKSDPPGTEIAVCQLGRFRPGVGASPGFSKLPERIVECLSSRIRVYDTGVFLDEDRNLLVVMRLQPLGREAREIIRGALVSLFREESARWSDSREFPAFRWMKLEGDGAERRIRIPGAAVL